MTTSPAAVFSPASRCPVGKTASRTRLRVPLRLSASFASAGRAAAGGADQSGVAPNGDRILLGLGLHSVRCKTHNMNASFHDHVPFHRAANHVWTSARVTQGVGRNHEPSACKPHLIMLTRRAPVAVVENVAVGPCCNTRYPLLASLPLSSNHRWRCGSASGGGAAWVTFHVAGKSSDATTIVPATVKAPCVHRRRCGREIILRTGATTRHRQWRRG